MVSTFTPNIQLEEPARGDYVGTWDTPVNNNMTLADLTIGGFTTITLNNSPVVLSAAQFQCKTIVFSSTLTGSVTITFPTSFKKSYEIYNLCTGSSAFVVTLTTTAVAQAICAPPGEIVEVINFGTNINFKNLGRVGEYWDYAGSSVPAWVSGCTVPPYLNCDGTAFSSATYPTLATILGGTTLPDSKGRARFALDQSAGRLSSAVSGFSPNTVGAGGGAQATTISSVNVPPVPITDPGHKHTYATNSPFATTAGSAGSINTLGASILNDTSTVTTGITAGSTSPAAFSVLPPAYIGGIVMIRAG